jgi:hypothetical protein
MKGFKNNGFLKMIEIKIMMRKRPPPQRNPRPALPSRSDINHENEMTRKRRKNRNIKLTMEIKRSKLTVFERILMLVSLNICNLVSRYSLKIFLLS